MIISYEEYKNYGGNLDKAAFNIYGYEAERKLISETHGRIKKITEAILRCFVRLTDIVAKSDMSKDKVTSWSNDGVSQSVKDVSAEEYSAMMDDIIKVYLSEEVDENGTPLLCLGVDA